MRPVKSFIAGGRRWKLRFTRPLKWVYGDVDPGTREVRIDDSLEGEKRLEIIIHEVAHCCMPYLDEEFISQYSKEISKVLWRLGYRLQDD